MKTSELTGAALDWAVAQCEGLKPYAYNYQCAHRAEPHGGGIYFRPSTDWAQGGPIIERERIDVAWCEEGWYANMYWRGLDVIPAAAAGVSFRCGGDGPTPLIAAMRCYVASKLGDDVQTPEELLS